MFQFFVLLHRSIVFWALMLSTLHGYCWGNVSAVDRYIVSFVPPVTVHDGVHFLDCIGVMVSPDRIALTSACAADAREHRKSGAVAVKNNQGEYIGQLPAIGDQPLDAVQALFENERQMPFVSHLGPAFDFPTFVDTGLLLSTDLEAEAYYLLFPAEQAESEEDVVHPKVHLRKLESSKSEFSLGGIGPARLGQYPVGSPVVDKLGRVACLLGSVGDCETIEQGVGVDDGSCRIDYFVCANTTWSVCESGSGKGQCVNEASQELCVVIVLPDMYDVDNSSPPLHCRNTGGCGAMFCPSDCSPQTGNCDCVTGWGFCELRSGKKTFTNPVGCMDQHGGTGNVDPMCHDLQPTTEQPTASPDDFEHSPAFLGVVIGVPAAVVFLGVTAVTTIIAVACKYGKRSGYGTVQ